MLKHLQAHKVRAKGGLLHGRDEGRRIREEIVDILESSPPDGILPIDFEAVRFIDFSCSDEFLTKLLKRLSGDLTGRYIVLRNLRETVRENINAALELRQLVCLAESGGRIEVLGRIHSELLKTYETARIRGRITARDLVAAFGLRISAGSNRLARLSQLGLLARVHGETIERGGRHYVYVPVQ